MSLFLINSITHRDSGIYTCRARNHPEGRFSEENTTVTVLSEWVWKKWDWGGGWDIPPSPLQRGGEEEVEKRGKKGRN